jgi:lactate permease
MLIAVGMKPLKAAMVLPLANTAPTVWRYGCADHQWLSGVTGLLPYDLRLMVGRQTPFLAVIVPAAAGLHRRRKNGRQADLAGGHRGWPGWRHAVPRSQLLSELTDVVAAPQ